MRYQELKKLNLLTIGVFEEVFTFFLMKYIKKKKTEFLNQLSRGNSYSQCIFAWIDLRTYFQKKCVASRQVAVYFFYYSNLDYSV